MAWRMNAMGEGEEEWGWVYKSELWERAAAVALGCCGNGPWLVGGPRATACGVPAGGEEGMGRKARQCVINRLHQLLRDH